MTTQSRAMNRVVSRALMLSAVAAGVVALSAARVGAQDRETTDQGMTHQPAPIVQIFRESVKVGHTATHEKLEANFARTYARMPWANPYIAMTSVSGPAEAWFIQPYRSMAALEKELKQTDQAPAAMKADLDQLSAREAGEVEMTRVMTAAYREDLSLNPTVLRPQDRYVEVVTYRVRLGHSMDFVEAAKLARSGYEKANVGVSWMLYQVVAGAPSGTYLVFRHVDSLTKIGPDMSVETAFRNALGEEGMQRLMKLESDGMMSAESNYFALDPMMSNAPREFAQADPSFWAPKETAMARVGTAGKTKPGKQDKQ
jgi:hypothetical protein